VEALALKNEGDKRRLQDQLKLEQLKLQAYQRITNERIDQHDAVLGLDTKAGVPAMRTLAGGSPDQLPSTLPAPDPTSSNWYYTFKNGKNGPVTTAQLVYLLSARTITGETLVWNSDMEAWKPIKDLPEFQKLI